jgi:protocatechuate 3,4-dioxygenase beta subunit
MFLVGLISTQAAAPAQGPAKTAARVAGRVTAADTGAAIAGARVSMFPARPRIGTFTPPAEAITDQDGRFAFDGVAGGSYNLDVQKTGYVAFPDTPGRPQTIQLEPGQTISDIAVQLQRGAVVAGRVLDAAGQPLADVGVMALRRTTVGSQERYLPRSGPGQTNDIGEFRVAGLAPGDYIVAANPRGQAPFGGPGMTPRAATPAPRTVPVTTYYPGTHDQGTAQTIHVAAGQTVENIVFTLLNAPAYRVSGVIVDDAGTPIAGAVVSLMNDPRAGVFMGPPSGGRSRDDGTFVLTGIPSGSYRVTAMVPVTIRSGGGAGGGSVTTWSSAGSGGIAGGVSGGVVTGMNAGGPMQATEVVVADSDVGGVRVVVRR